MVGSGPVRVPNKENFFSVFPLDFPGLALSLQLVHDSDMHSTVLNLWHGLGTFPTGLVQGCFEMQHGFYVYFKCLVA
jgi:hypothetical protein